LVKRKPGIESDFIDGKAYSDNFYCQVLDSNGE
jgi:hypothetical protein